MVRLFVLQIKCMANFLEVRKHPQAASYNAVYYQPQGSFAPFHMTKTDCLVKLVAF